MNFLKHHPFAVAAAACALLLASSWLMKDYFIFEMQMVLVLAIAILGLNLLTGLSGQVSLGHGAFFAVGAYAYAILTEVVRLHYAAAIPAAGLACFVFGILVGFPALRLDGHRLALATFALALAIPQLLRHKSISEWTGGVQGLVVSKPPAPASLESLGLSPERWLFAISIAVALAMFLIAYNLSRGAVGRVLVAIRDQPIAAGAMGINLAHYKTMIFGVSAAYTGIAGALGALAVGFVAPDSFPAFLSVTLLVGVVIGGLGSVGAAIAGALFVQFVPEIATRLSQSAPWAIYGACLIAFMYFLPHGLAGIVRKK